MSNLLDNLNDEQTQAVTHREGPLLIVAGAGTGKTTVITRRMAWLIDQGLAKPEQILALTFTDKAAGEMEERVDRLLPYGYVDLAISTFHAFCEKLLREYGAEIGLSRDFRLVSELDAWLMMRRNLERFDLDYYRPLGNPTKYLRGLLSHFSRAKDAGIVPEQYLSFAEGKAADTDALHADEETQSEWKRLNELARAYHTYEQILLENDALDFGGLLLYALRLLRERPRVLETLRRRFFYVLVDEFQDTNAVQYELVTLLAAPRNNLSVVGDDDQSIYTFRGASIENILRFEKDFPNTVRVVLTHNYRSVQQVLDHAHGFIQQNNPHRLEAQRQLDKRLVSHHPSEGVVAHIHLPTLEEETEAVATKILELKEAHPDATWNDFAVLSRSNDAAVPFLSALDRHGIPYQFMALRGLYTKPAVLDMLAYLRAIATPHDSPSFYRVLAHPMRNIPELAIAELSQFATRKGKSLFEACNLVHLLNSLHEGVASTIQGLLSEMDRFRKDTAGRPVSELFVRVAREAGFVSWLNQLPESQKVESFRYLQQFYERLKRFEASHEHPVLRNFLDEFQHERDAGEEGSLQFDPDAGPDLVRVMTVHGSKGLEFRFVFVVSMIDQRFPATARAEAIPLPGGLLRGDEDKETKEAEEDKEGHLREERRLFYVALTRAKEHVYLTSADDYGGARTRKLSRFLTELGFEKPLGRDIRKPDIFLDPSTFPASQLTSASPTFILPKQFSFTQLSAFRTCPLQYKYAHILKIPVFGKHVFSFGKTMHNTLHRFFLSWMERSGAQQASLFADPKTQKSAAKNSVPVSLDELLQHYADCWQDDWYKDDQIREQYRERGREQLKGFYAFLADHPAKPTYLEQDFTLKIGGAIIKGRIDRVDETEGGVEIIDYKTGTPKEDGKLETSDKEQLLLYQLAAQDVLGLKAVKLTYHYLENNSQVSFVGTPDDLLDLREKIQERVEGIKQSRFTATPGYHCKFCDFADICEYRAS